MIYTKLQGILAGLVLLIDCLWIGSSSFFLHYNGVELATFLGMFVLFWTLYFAYKNATPLPKPIIAVQSTLLLLLYTKFSLILSYLAYTTNQPLVNSALASLDELMRFNVSSLFSWFQAHPWWNTFFTLIYESSKFQVLFIVIYFSFFGNPIYLQRFIMLFMISIPLAIFIGALWPAVGTYAWYHYPPDEIQSKVFLHFHELRQHILNIETQDGIVEFPSFHTTMALMFAYTFRHERNLIFIPILFLNVLMIFSCLSQGGHYLVDILGGIAVFIVVAGVEKHLFYSLSFSSQKQRYWLDKKEREDYKSKLIDKVKTRVHG